MRFLAGLAACVIVIGSSYAAGPVSPDPDRDILITFENSGARATSASGGAPYRFRKRYAISREVERVSREVAAQHDLQQIDHWPIKSLSVYCFVYRVPEGANREELIAKLETDERIESVQILQRFESRLGAEYNDPYAGMQHGLLSLNVAAAHRYTHGAGVRIAIVDSLADNTHEDLEGRISLAGVFASDRADLDTTHGTAVASVIGARSNNALGIVGIAPEADLELYVSCWRETESVVCDSFSLAKALDHVLDDPPQVINLSLAGPDDRLVGRLIRKALDNGVLVISAHDDVNTFPASVDGVISIARSGHDQLATPGKKDRLFAPGDEIMVALPHNKYDFRSGSSLSAAHVSGVVALLLSVSPEETSSTIKAILAKSQRDHPRSINACVALSQLVESCACGD